MVPVLGSAAWLIRVASHFSLSPCLLAAHSLASWCLGPESESHTHTCCHPLSPAGTWEGCPCSGLAATRHVPPMNGRKPLTHFQSRYPVHLPEVVIPWGLPVGREDCFPALSAAVTELPVLCVCTARVGPWARGSHSQQASCAPVSTALTGK